MTGLPAIVLNPGDNVAVALRDLRLVRILS